MNLFKIETGVKRQGSEIKDQGSGVRGQGSVVNCEAGFTIVELIVVLAIMSILVGMAYSALRTPNEKIACKEIYSNLQLAKMRAVSTGVDVAVNVDTDLNSVEDVSVPEEVTYIPGAGGTVNQAWSEGFPSGGIDFEGGNIVTFTPKGMATSGSVYLYDVNNSNRLCAVRVLTTGLIMMSTSVDMGVNWN